MAEIKLSINNKKYDISCRDGQEAHVERLGQMLDERVQRYSQSVGQAGEARLLMLASLALLDELEETRAELRKLGGDEWAGGRGQSIAETVEKLTKRIETIAARWEAA